nr:hypothetical protein Iba_chr12aCG10250 [Ipomoea batatas]
MESNDEENKQGDKRPRFNNFKTIGAMQVIVVTIGKEIKGKNSMEHRCITTARNVEMDTLGRIAKEI